MLGILLAGGKGSRLLPLTRAMSKQMIPVHHQPVIMYGLSTLMLAGIRNIVVVVDPATKNQFSNLFGDGNSLGVDISYAIQENPNGVPDAIMTVEKRIKEESRIALMLGDNILHGSGLGTSLGQKENQKGAQIFATWVKNPRPFGVVELDKNGRVISLEEKPVIPKSNFAVPGLYFFDGQVADIAKNLQPNLNGELQIADVNNVYLELGLLSVETLPRSTAWMDIGTFPSLAEATDYVRAVEKRQGLKIGCPEEVAWRMGYIDDNQLAKLAEPLMKSGYGQYLLGLLERGK